MESNEILQNVERVQVGIVGVDRARIMVCDPSYIEEERLYERDKELETQQLDGLMAAGSDQEAGRSAYPLHYKIPYLLGHEGAAVVVRSGVGDGAYPVYATIADVEGMGRRVVRLEVDFLEHPWMATMPLELPDAYLKVMERLQAWLPTVEGPQAQDLLLQLNSIVDHYKGGEDDATK